MLTILFFFLTVLGLLFNSPFLFLLSISGVLASLFPVLLLAFLVVVAVWAFNRFR